MLPRESPGAIESVGVELVVFALIHGEGFGGKEVVGAVGLEVVLFDLLEEVVETALVVGLGVDVLVGLAFLDDFAHYYLTTSHRSAV